jgi:hypothetical protein
MAKPFWKIAVHEAIDSSASSSITNWTTTVAFVINVRMERSAVGVMESLR